MVTMNNILAFVKKAMNDDLNISTFKDETISYSTYIIEIKGENRYCEIRLCDKNIIIISMPGLNNIYIKNIPEQDLLLFKLLFLEVKEYSNNKSLEYFNSFFKNEENKEVKVDDLDDDEDDELDERNNGRNYTK